jgi:hypothetical protein
MSADVPCRRVNDEMFISSALSIETVKHKCDRHSAAQSNVEARVCNASVVDMLILRVKLVCCSTLSVPSYNRSAICWLSTLQR